MRITVIFDEAGDVRCPVCGQKQNLDPNFLGSCNHLYNYGKSGDNQYWIEFRSEIKKEETK